MFGQVWLRSARVVLRGCRQRTGVVTVTEGAVREHVGHDVGLGRSAEAREARLSILDLWWAAARSAEYTRPPPSQSYFGNSPCL